MLFRSAGLIGAADELDSSRNMPVPKAIGMLFFPRNDCFHLVHHLFPQVPTRHLRDCHGRLLSHPEYRARIKDRVGRKQAASNTRPESVVLHP